MKIFPQDFYFPSGADTEAGALAQEAMYSSQHFEELLPYFDVLESRFRFGSANPVKVSASKLWSIQQMVLKAYLKLAASRYKKVTADVLVIGECRRASEIRMMCRLLKGISECGMSVIYMVAPYTEEYKELKAFAQSQNLKDITFIAPLHNGSKYERFAARKIAYGRAHYDLHIIQNLLPDNVSINGNLLGMMVGPASAKCGWGIQRHYLHFDAVFARNHFTPLSTFVSLDSLKKGKVVVTTQHGVISAPTTFVPIIATKHLCFGKISSVLLRKMDQMLANEANHPTFCNEFLPVGSFFDDLPDLPSNFDCKSLLVIDQHATWSERFYNISQEYETLVKVVTHIVEQDNGIKKVIIRLHPDNKDFDDWLALVDLYPDRVEISHPAYSFTHDLKRSSLAIGLFSGGLATAAACGIPALFLWQPGWFYTPDLSCFTDDFFVEPDEAVNRTYSWLEDHNKYEVARKKAIECSANYYHNRQLCTFEPDFIRRLFARDEGGQHK